MVAEKKWVVVSNYQGPGRFVTMGASTKGAALALGMPETFGVFRNPIPADFNRVLFGAEGKCFNDKIPGAMTCRDCNLIAGCKDGRRAYA